MKRLKTKILIMLVVGILSFVIVPVALAWPFDDVPVGYWAYTQIHRIANIHVTSGCGGTNFCPENYVTRAQMAVFMDNYSKAYTTANEPFITSVDNRDNGATFSGDGIVAKSYDQNGLEGITYGGTWADYGVYGESNGTGTSDYAIYGYSTATSNSPAVGGYAAGPNTGASYGLYGFSANDHGVVGDSDGNYDYYGGWFTGSQGVYAQSEDSGSDAITARCTAGGNCWGLDTYSSTSYGIYASTGDASNNYGLYTPDNIYSLNYHVAGGFAMIAINGGVETLEAGDTVAVIGMGAPLPDSDYPVMLVARAEAANASAVVGVVTSAYQIEMVSRPDTQYVETVFPDQEGKGNPSATYYMPVSGERQVAVQTPVAGPVAPGGYMLIQIQGLAQVKVETGAAIQAGDLLTIGPAGTAVRAEPTVISAEGAASYQAGTILGKALEPLRDGMDKIWVMVDLR